MNTIKGLGWLGAVLIATAGGPLRAQEAEGTIKYMWNDFSSPLRADTRPLLEIGGVVTLGLYLMKETVINPIQEDVHERKPLGHTSKFGDLAGQLVPNAVYVLGMLGSGWIRGNPEDRYRGLFMLRSTFYSGLTAVLIKTILQEERPNASEHHNSFPSGHSTTAFAFAGAVMAQHAWYFSLPALALAGFVGFSRMNDNFHFLHDVAGGATLGLSYAFGLLNQDRERGVFSQVELRPWPVRDGRGLQITYRF